MKITREHLKQAKNGMEIIQRTGKDVYIKLRTGDERYIDYIIEKGNWYFCGQGEDAYVYWQNGVYGFTFSPDIFIEEPIKKT